MRERLASLAESIRRNYESLRAGASSARASDPSLAEKVAPHQLPETICAVDGGLLSHRMHGADIALTRAVAAIFTYGPDGLRSCAYHPSRSPPPSVHMESSLDEHESLVFRSLARLRHELSCAMSALEAHSPRLLLMDGALLPLPSDRPPADSTIFPLYSEVLGLYASLFAKAEAKGCMLCGVVKDSRARKLSKALGLACSDSVLCGFLLEPGERTRAMPYFEEKAPGGDVARLSGRISVFYIRPSEADLPLRVEVLGGRVDEAASAVLALSSLSESFAYPAPLVEADLCAALDPSELEPIEASLFSLSGLRPLRRNSRPFR